MEERKGRKSKVEAKGSGVGGSVTQDVDKATVRIGVINLALNSLLHQGQLQLSRGQEGDALPLRPCWQSPHPKPSAAPPSRPHSWPKLVCNDQSLLSRCSQLLLP